MSRKLDREEQTAFATGLDGEVYMNAFELDGVETLEDVRRLVETTKTRFFVGVVLTPSERKRLLPVLRSAGSDAAGSIAGRRRWNR